jgi:hypothetical protein
LSRCAVLTGATGCPPLTLSPLGIEILSLECGEIREILWPTYRSLVPYQCVSAKDENRNAINHRRHFRVECFVGIHTCETGQQINSVGDSPELNDLLGLEKISFFEAGLLEPKLIQNREQ